MPRSTDVVMGLEMLNQQNIQAAIQAVRDSGYTPRRLVLRVKTYCDLPIRLAAQPRKRR